MLFLDALSCVIPIFVADFEQVHNTSFIRSFIHVVSSQCAHTAVSLCVQQPGGHQSACPAVGHDCHAVEWRVITHCMSLNFTLFKIISSRLQPFSLNAVGSSNQRVAEARTAAQLCDSRRWELLSKESMHFTQ